MTTEPYLLRDKMGERIKAKYPMISEPELKLVVDGAVEVVMDYIEAIQHHCDPRLARPILHRASKGGFVKK